MAAYGPSIAAELIRMLYRHVPAVLAANLVNSSLVVAALWPHEDHRILMAWAGAVLVLTLVRVGLWLSCRHRLGVATATVRWGWPYTLGAGLSGALWGSTAILFVDPGNPGSLILVSFVIGGMGAGAVTSLSAHLPTFYLYLFCSILPLVLRLISLGDRTGLAMAGMALVYVVGLVIIGRNFNAALIRALELNEENERLLATREEEIRLRTADLQQANIRLDEARAEAEHANQAKSRFLAAASHDLRQPLQSMFLFAATLHHYVTQKTGVDALVRIERGLDVLKGMLDSLLDLSRLDVNIIEPNLATCPLRPMLDDIVAAYRRIAASKGITLRCLAFDDVHIRSDPVLLGRMIRNLVENALRYTERGCIALSVVRLDGSVRIEVQDTGIGIAPHQLERIFEEFHQVGNPERDKARGLGLGLAIVQRLSRILGHPVEVTSELGAGSTFSVEVPLAEQEAAAEPEVAEPEAEPYSGAGRRMMVIDDDPMVLLALSCTFEQWGYAVTMAGSEDEAVSLLQPEAAPDLIISDYRLRNGRVGTDAIRGVRAACGADIPGIVLTGETGTECLAEAESVGALVLHKPVTPHHLAFALKRLTGVDAAG